MPNREIKEARNAPPLRRANMTKPLMPTQPPVAAPRPVAATDASARRVVGPASPEVQRQYMEADRQGSIAESQRQRAAQVEAQKAAQGAQRPVSSTLNTDMARGLRTVLKPRESIEDRMRRSGAE